MNQENSTLSSKVAASGMSDKKAAQNIVAAADNAIAEYLDSDDICPPLALSRASAVAGKCSFGTHANRKHLPGRAPAHGNPKGCGLGVGPCPATCSGNERWQIDGERRVVRSNSGPCQPAHKAAAAKCDAASALMLALLPRPFDFTHGSTAARSCNRC